MSNINIIGIDLAKDIFQVCALSHHNKVLFNRPVKRHNLLDFISQYKARLIAMESCASSHYWARVFQQAGYTVKLIPAQHVKALIRTNKSDYHDAFAIVEAALRPHIHDVPVKSIEQQDLQALLRIRMRYKDNRVACINQSRGLLAEYGIVFPKSIAGFNIGMHALMNNHDNALSPIARGAIYDLYQEYLLLCDKIKQIEHQINQLATQHPLMSQLLRLRGIGPITAVAIYSSIGQAAQFKNARHLAAWIGLVPKHTGTGGKIKLGAISKRGNAYLRQLLIHGARTVMNWMKNKTDYLSQWAKSLAQRRGKHKAIVAIANKTARMIWVALNKGVEALPSFYLSAA